MPAINLPRFSAALVSLLIASCGTPQKQKTPVETLSHETPAAVVSPSKNSNTIISPAKALTLALHHDEPGYLVLDFANATDNAVRVSAAAVWSITSRQGTEQYEDTAAGNIAVDNASLVIPLPVVSDEVSHPSVFVWADTNRNGLCDDEVFVLAEEEGGLLASGKTVQPTTSQDRNAVCSHFETPVSVEQPFLLKVDQLQPSRTGAYDLQIFDRTTSMAVTLIENSQQAKLVPGHSYTITYYLTGDGSRRDIEVSRVQSDIHIYPGASASFPQTVYH